MSNVKVKRFSNNKRVLSRGILKWNIKTLAPTVQKLLERLKFSKSMSNSKVKVTGSKILVPFTRNTLMEYQSSSTHVWKARNSKVKVSVRITEFQKTKRKQYAPDLRSPWHKNMELRMKHLNYSWIHIIYKVHEIHFKKYTFTLIKWNLTVGKDVALIFLMFNITITVVHLLFHQLIVQPKQEAHWSDRSL